MLVIGAVVGLGAELASELSSANVADTKERIGI